MKNTNNTTNTNKMNKEETKMKNTARKTTRTIAAAMAALMLSTTAASFGASAANVNSGFGKTAEEIVAEKLAGKSYGDVLKTWNKVMDDPLNAFPGGCDIDGDGVETKEEKNEIADKVKEYAAGVTVGLMKMGLNAMCDGLADCFEGPMGDLANAIFDVPKEASNDDIMDKLDETTNQVISKITESEKNIITKVSNLNVASTYGNAFDQLEGRANTCRTEIRQALTVKTDNEKAVAIASKLGDMNEWGKHPAVGMKGIAYNYLTAESCATEFDHGYNLYDIAFRAALDKGSLFMKEAVENSQLYIAQCTDKYVKSCMTLLQMLTAMQKVDKLTPAEVSAMPQTAQEDYRKLKAHANQAYFYETEILNELFGKDGIVNKSAAYVQRKVTEPTTYVGRGMTVHVKLKKDLDYCGDLGFIEPYQERTFGGCDWRWRKNSDKNRMDNSGLTYKEVEGICKHAFETGYTVENYLKANGFSIDEQCRKAYAKLVLVTDHYDEYHGKAFRGYYSYEGFNGYDLTGKYAKGAASPKWSLIKKMQEGLGLYLNEYRENKNYGFLFFVKA